MLNFQPITLQDRACIESYTMQRGLMNCDLSFANIYCWRAFYQSTWAEVEHSLVIRFQIDGSNRIGYMEPIGEGELTRIIPLLEADAAALGQPLRLVGLRRETADRLAALYPEKFAFYADPATQDYIYRAEDLRALTGRNYQPKRNHINRFRTHYPDYSYRPLTAERIEECIRLEQEWCRHRGGCTEGSLLSERQAMQNAFANFEALGLMGGCLYVGEELVAFTYGSWLNHNTIDIHIEKADTRYEGAFTMINRLFAEQLPPEALWINREEDLGIEGLRKAKRSYYPAELLTKVEAVVLDPARAACKRLWERCFPEDEPTFVDWFLNRYMDPARMITITAEGQTVAMVHRIAFESPIGRINYLYALATDPDYRHRGYASQLVEQVLEADRAEGCVATLLIAATPELRTFYAERGFEGELPIAFYTPDRFDFGTGNSELDHAMCYRHTAETLPEHIVLTYL